MELFWTNSTSSVRYSIGLGFCTPHLSLQISGEGSYMDEQVERQKTTIGIDTVQLGSIGVYHYRLNGLNTGLSTCSVIANSGPRVSNLDFILNLF